MNLNTPAPVVLNQTASLPDPIAPPSAVTRAAPPATVRAASAPATSIRTQPPPEKPQELRAFSDWAQQYLARAGSVSEARGRALAWKRREAMLELIQQDPERALALAVPFRWRQALPASVTQYFGEQIDGRGSFEVALASGEAHERAYRWVKVGGRTLEAFVYGRRLGQASQSDITLHGIALGGKLALAADPVRVLDPAEAAAREQAGPTPRARVCAVCGQPATVAADIGGEMAWYCGVEHEDIVNRHWLDLERSAKGGGSLAKDLNVWSLGPKRLLYMRVNFPDDLTEPISEDAAYAVMDQVNDFYVENSYGLTELTTVVTPLLTLPRRKAAYSEGDPLAVLEDARAAARAAGFDTQFFDFDIVAFTSVQGFDWAGLGYVGWRGTWLQSMGAGVTAHELGHNYGVMHANFWDTSTNNNSGIAQGWNVEYGNAYDTMGAASAGRNHFNAFFKNQLKWLPSTSIAAPSSNGVYRLYGFDLPQRLNGPAYAVRMAKDFQRDYWLEFRQQFSFDPTLANGVLLNWSPWDESAGGTDLIDTTFGKPALGLTDPALVIGRTFGDTAAGLYITPLRRGVDGTNAWIDLQINRGAFVGNQPPMLAIEVDIPNPRPGELVHFHAETVDPDGDGLAYAWWFDNAQFSTNNLDWASKTWSAEGLHVVRCVASDMKGGIASANTVVTVGKPSGNLIVGLITDTNGLPVEGVRVADTNGCACLLSYTDSEGRYIIPGVTNEVELLAEKYGFTFTNITWTNPIAAGADTLQADFIATALPVVTIAAVPETLPENSSTPAYFLLKRSGDTATNLLVNVYLTGSATLGRDYGLDADLGSGTNTLEFPPGIDTLQIALTSTNDRVVEATESATLAVREGDGYVIGSLGQATIQILDDDSQGLPAVSVAASNPLMLENGMDTGEVVFTRPNTAGDLYVYYGMTGTATPGVDYLMPAGVVLIPSGQTSASVRFQPIDDKEVEPDETIMVSVLPNSAYVAGGASAQITIIDDDKLIVTTSATSATAAEPDTPGRFTVKREGDLTANLKVRYTISGTATSDADYVPLSGELLIPAGSASADIVVTPRDDALVEGDESVTMTLNSNAGYDVGTPGSATLFIADDEEPTVTVRAGDDTASEPGDNFATFVISRGNVSHGALTVNLAISGTAWNGIDYVPLDNFVVIPDGESKVTIDVIPFDDLHLEPKETVQLVLLPGANYSVGNPADAEVFIEDDDYGHPAVGFTFSSSSAPESESPGLALSLSSSSWGPVTVNYVVIGGTATTNDYELPEGPFTIDAGRTNAILPLKIHDNAIAQPHRTIRIALFDPISATLDGIKIHTYTILDDDSAALSITATAPDAFENGSATGNFRIARVGNTNADLTVFFQVAGSAGAPADYTPLGNSVVIPAGAAYVDLPVAAVDDQITEPDETVTMELIRAPGGKIVAPALATVTIHDNDPNKLPSIQVSSTDGPNAVEGGRAGAVTFRRSSTVGELIVYFTVTGSATAGADYSALPTSVTFAEGQSTVTLPVSAIDDSAVEGEESVVLAVTQDDTYHVLYPGSATVLIQDNDQRVWVDASDFIAAEPGTDPGEFTFTRYGTTNDDVRVYFTLSGTAINGVDYVHLTNSVVIPAGSLSVTLPLQVLDDPLVEGPDTVTLTLAPGISYAVADPKSATITIEDDEPMLTITATTPTVMEGSQNPGVLTVRRAGDPRYEFFAHLEVGGSAGFGVDYPPFATDLFFACGITEIDLPIHPTNELQIEGPETVTAALLPSPDYTILSPSNAVVTIEDAGLDSAPIIVFERPRSQPVHLFGPTVTLLTRAKVTPSDATNTWSLLDGPCPVSFGEVTNPCTTITFTNGGFYLLRLTADDGLLQSYFDLTVTVIGEDLFEDAQLHWTLDDQDGATASDSSGHGRDGVLVGNPAWVANGFIGGALEFHGPDDFLRGTGVTNLFNNRKAFSVSLWVNLVTNLDQAIFCANTGATNGTLALYARRFATCGPGTDVYEATLRTSVGDVHYVSSSQAVKSGWHHLLLTWSSGSGLVLYLDGQRDRPGTRSASLGGAVANAPEFVLGKGPPTASFSLQGQIDDVMVFPTAVSETEAAGIASGACPGGVCMPANFGPVVDAGTNVTVQLPIPVQLAGSVTDDGLPDPPAAVSTYWELVTGPAPVEMSATNALTNTVHFSVTGTNIFRLTADDGDILTCDEVTVLVVEPTQVYLWASDPEGAELGPDPAEFTLWRYGGIDYELAVYLEFGGIATNGVDFVPLTNVITFPIGADTVTIPVVPYLDHRTEGDQDLTLTILTNAAYSIASGEATIIIHDSPYGTWTIDHFTLEELTDPSLSGEAADFDEDGLFNFVEYAANQDPKLVATNPPLVVTIQPDTGTGEPHVVLTFHRRVEPTDVGYAPAVSEDLLTWHSGTNYVEEVSAIDDGNFLTETVTARVRAPLSTKPNQFVTVRVWLETTQP